MHNMAGDMHRRAKLFLKVQLSCGATLSGESLPCFESLKNCYCFIFLRFASPTPVKTRSKSLHYHRYHLHNHLAWYICCSSMFSEEEKNTMKIFVCFYPTFQHPCLPYLLRTGSLAGGRGRACLLPRVGKKVFCVNLFK